MNQYRSTTPKNAKEIQEKLEQMIRQLTPKRQKCEQYYRNEVISPIKENLIHMKQVEEKQQIIELLEKRIREKNVENDQIKQNVNHRQLTSSCNQFNRNSLLNTNNYNQQDSQHLISASKVENNQSPSQKLEDSQILNPDHFKESQMNRYQQQKMILDLIDQNKILEDKDTKCKELIKLLESQFNSQLQIYKQKEIKYENKCKFLFTTLEEKDKELKEIVNIQQRMMQATIKELEDKFLQQITQLKEEITNQEIQIQDKINEIFVKEQTIQELKVKYLDLYKININITNNFQQQLAQNINNSNNKNQKDQSFNEYAPIKQKDVSQDKTIFQQNQNFEQQKQFRQENDFERYENQSLLSQEYQDFQQSINLASQMSFKCDNQPQNDLNQQQNKDKLQDIEIMNPEEDSFNQYFQSMETVIQSEQQFIKMTQSQNISELQQKQSIKFDKQTQQQQNIQPQQEIMQQFIGNPSFNNLASEQSQYQDSPQRNDNVKNINMVSNKNNSQNQKQLSNKKQNQQEENNFERFLLDFIQEGQKKDLCKTIIALDKSQRSQNQFRNIENFLKSRKNEQNKELDFNKINQSADFNIMQRQDPNEFKIYDLKNNDKSLDTIQTKNLFHAKDQRLSESKVDIKKQNSILENYKNYENKNQEQQFNLIKQQKLQKSYIY